MFFICSQKYKNNDYFGVKDTEDGVVEFYTIQELQQFTDKGIEIDGLILDDNNKIVNIIRAKVPSFLYFCRHNSSFFHLLDEWNYLKNTIKPYEISKSDNRLVWWKCSNGHEWQSSVHSRTRTGSGHLNLCPVCFKENRDTSTSFSEQVLYYYFSKLTRTILHYKLDNREFDIFLPEYNLIIEYESIIHKEYNSYNNYYYKNELAKKNGLIVIRISEFKCSYDNCYTLYCNNNLDEIISCILSNLNIYFDEGFVNSLRDRYAILSSYNRRLTCSDRNLLIRHPNVVKFWDYTKNNPLKPEDFSHESREIVWWVCEFCNESFKAPIHHIFDKSEDFIRIHNKCKILQYNRVKKLHKGTEPYYFSELCPELVQYWSSKNRYKPTELSYKSRLNIIFNCSVCGREIERILSGVAKSKLCKCNLCKSRGL